MIRWLSSLEPSNLDYVLIKKALLARQKKESRFSEGPTLSDTLLNLQRSLQLYRWIFHFGLDQFVLVNIAAARLDLYENGSSVIDMRAIVGKPATPTPRFASFCKQLILYPYWYVPASIAIGEYLSKIKRNPGWLDQRNMQVVDARGRVVDHHRLNWREFHAGYFPYTIRQSTGCDNALGVLKFDIETPYGVYLHDTNHKSAFLQASRFLSHGCIRLEEPLLLGSRLLRAGLDTAYLQSCYADKKPVARALGQPVAVFCLYLPATIDAEGQLRLHRDVYKLFVK
jgi:murein L,D-transpeptidase YcbB/YkuD